MKKKTSNKRLTLDHEVVKTLVGELSGHQLRDVNGALRTIGTTDSSHPACGCNSAELSACPFA